MRCRDVKCIPCMYSRYECIAIPLHIAGHLLFRIYRQASANFKAHFFCIHIDARQHPAAIKISVFLLKISLSNVNGSEYSVGGMPNPPSIIAASGLQDIHKAMSSNSKSANPQSMKISQISVDLPSLYLSSTASMMVSIKSASTVCMHNPCSLCM